MALPKRDWHWLNSIGDAREEAGAYWNEIDHWNCLHGVEKALFAEAVHEIHKLRHTIQILEGDDTPQTTDTPTTPQTTDTPTTPATPQTAPRVGLLLKGYCNGYFDSNFTSEKRVEAIGTDWVVVRTTEGVAYFATFNDSEDIEDYLIRWSQTEEDD